jgi:hypothetical protein
MNLGISNTQVSAWKRIKTQHIAAAAGVALVVSALVAGFSLRNDSATPGAPQATAPSTINQPSPQPQSFVYVVGGQAEAEALVPGLATSAQERGDGAYASIMVVDSLAAERDLQIMLGELELSGQAGAVTVVDLR